MSTLCFALLECDSLVVDAQVLGHKALEPAAVSSTEMHLEMHLVSAALGTTRPAKQPKPSLWFTLLDCDSLVVDAQVLGHKALESEAVSSTAVHLVSAALGAGDDPASQVVLADALQLLTGVLGSSSQLTADLQVRPLLLSLLDQAVPQAFAAADCVCCSHPRPGANLPAWQPALCTCQAPRCAGQAKM